MRCIAEYELQRMFAGQQFDHRLGLTAAEMHMPVVGTQRRRDDIAIMQVDEMDLLPSRLSQQRDATTPFVSL